MSDHETPRSRATRIADVALSVSAVAGVVCILVALAALIFGVTPLVFRSGSMAPAIPTGSLAVARTVPATEIVPGDVVSVFADNGNRITHRVESVGEPTGNSVPLVLKGDANDVADAAPYVVTDVERVLLDAPYLGYLIAWSSTPTALAAGIILAATLLVVTFRPRRRVPRGDTPDGPDPANTPIGPARPDGPRHALGEWRTGAPVVALTLAAVLTFAEPSPARAAFTDTTAGQVTLTMGTAPRIASLTCTTEGNIFEINTAILTWPVVGADYRYRLAYRGLTGINLGTYEVPAQASGTLTLRLTPAVLTGLPPILIFNVVVYTLVGTNWISVDGLTRRIDKTAAQSRCDTSGTVTTAGTAATARGAQSTSPTPSFAGPSVSDSTTPDDPSSSTRESPQVGPSTSTTPGRPEVTESPSEHEQPSTTTEPTTAAPAAAEPEPDASASSSTSASPRGYDVPES
ncbi:MULTISPECIES: signal peptidase I [Gordonia]|uniref:signal peptidase I n=1 Tax=Gordonia TaxID=2053 RepID=UPI0012BB3997|nr:MULTISPECIES: signal peptidase I [Gordonia]MDH3007065.1 signal peptidase I [Gordonia alkanivorans]MDH3013281.1 signal peptidase I [Gordonia alkanivorans]MDH3045725.1 signal peptidase I [Gordonia alkanivorans]MDJ0027376.1 signal peptidase I [Gordonia alkanivorans]QGP86556.1 signal peptidase I [Gordonia sp. 135]